MRVENALMIAWRTILLTAATATLLVLSLGFANQTQPALQITSPPDESVLKPGQTITVSVRSLTNITFKQVFVIGERPLPTSSIATSVPAQFPMLIPQSTRPGKYLLTAWGTTTANQVQPSAAITVDVESADLPTSLTANKTRISFDSQGERVPLRISGRFADGSVVDLTVSSNLAYTSSNTSVATVNSNGVVAAVAAGNASITAKYGQGAQSVSVSVPVTVPPGSMIHVPIGTNPHA
jgi:hypothetical protein